MMMVMVLYTWGVLKGTVCFFFLNFYLIMFQSVFDDYCWPFMLFELHANCYFPFCAGTQFFTFYFA